MARTFLAVLAIVLGASAQAEEITFRHPLDDKPLEMDLRPDQEITPAVETFHETGKNPYSGDPEAIEAGKELWTKWCRACHLSDGTGRIGPSLVDDEVRYSREKPDVGPFEVIYAGATGAMQAFGKRMDQDDILKVMAYMERLPKKADE